MGRNVGLGKKDRDRIAHVREEVCGSCYCKCLNYEAVRARGWECGLESTVRRKVCNVV